MSVLTRAFTALLFSMSIGGLLTMVSCRKENAKSKKMTVVTSMYPQYDFARAVVGDRAEVMMLLKAGAESHSYEPTPKDIQKIQNAGLFIYNGGENDVWADSLLEGFSNGGPEILRFMDMVNVLEEEVVDGMTIEQGHIHKDGEGEKDEHVWTSPLNAILIIQKISEELCRIDRENAASYRQNAASYCARIRQLHSRFESVVASAKRKQLVFGDRFPLRYFADCYGLSYYAAFPGCAADVEANASTIKFLIQKVKAEKIPVVLTIEFSNGKIADTICESTGSKKMEFHSCHNVSADDMQKGETYVSLMERNIAVLDAALN